MVEEPVRFQNSANQQQEQQPTDCITDNNSLETIDNSIVNLALRPEPQGGGDNLFLTCFRLRVEEAGGWETALQETPAPRQTEEQVDCPDPQSTDQREPRADGGNEKALQETPEPLQTEEQVDCPDPESTDARELRADGGNEAALQETPAPRQTEDQVDCPDPESTDARELHVDGGNETALQETPAPRQTEEQVDWPDPESTDAREPRADGGNIFLTCLRLRYEEVGSWSQVLQERLAPRLSANSEEMADRSDLVSTDADVNVTELEMSPARSNRRNWKEWSGREHGTDRYQVGDVARVGARKVSELVRRWKPPSGIPDTSA